jgi:3',5'-cyclic AMP phosphodiesterase CpdA
MRIAHISDIHFGRIVIPEIVDSLVGEINERGVDLVAVSGDLTQRARRWQFQAARSMIDRFQAPVIVVPGNHDVYAWWYPHARIIRPLERYERFITSDLSPTYEADGIAALGINSAYGRTIAGGRIGSTALSAMSEFFGQRSNELFKVLVVHHHLTKIQALGVHDVAGRARKALEIASRTGVDLILCGHVHISHIEPVVISPAGHRVVIVSAGTATSSRGRKSNRKTNFYNVIEADAANFRVEERRYDPDRHIFEIDAVTNFERHF